MLFIFIHAPDQAYIAAKAKLPGYVESVKEELPLWDIQKETALQEAEQRAVQAAYEAGRANVPADWRARRRSTPTPPEDRTISEKIWRLKNRRARNILKPARRRILSVRRMLLMDRKKEAQKIREMALERKQRMETDPEYRKKVEESRKAFKEVFGWTEYFKHDD